MYGSLNHINITTDNNNIINNFKSLNDSLQPIKL